MYVRGPGKRNVPRAGVGGKRFWGGRVGGGTFSCLFLLGKKVFYLVSLGGQGQFFRFLVKFFVRGQAGSPPGSKKPGGRGQGGGRPRPRRCTFWRWGEEGSPAPVVTGRADKTKKKLSPCSPTRGSADFNPRKNKKNRLPVVPRTVQAFPRKKNRIPHGRPGFFFRVGGPNRGLFENLIFYGP